MHKCAVFLLAVIACSHLVSSVEAGRQIKSVNNKVDSKQSNQLVDKSAFMPKEDHHQPAALSYIPKAAVAHNSGPGKKEVLPPPLPDSVAGYKDAFRPTTPGNRPGAGHSFPGANDDKHSIAGEIDDFRRTNPGHSPGAGHSFPGANDDKHSIAGERDDFRRTNPGHSPGVGHVFQSKDSEPNA